MKSLNRERLPGLHLRATLICSTAFVASCTPRPPLPGEDAYEKLPHVLFEACLPKEHVVFERRHIDEAYLSDPRIVDAWNRDLVPRTPRTVDWVEIGEGTAQFSIPAVTLEETTKFSDGMQSLELAGSTATGQPVYRSTIRGEAISQDYLGVGLWEPRKVAAKNSETPVYWFKVPADLSTKAFGSWQSPDWVSTSSDMTFWKLMHDRPLDKSTVPSGAPRLRFMLMTTSDLNISTGPWYLSQYAARLQYAKEREFRAGYRSVPVTGETFPGC